MDQVSTNGIQQTYPNGTAGGAYHGQDNDSKRSAKEGQAAKMEDEGDPEHDVALIKQMRRSNSNAHVNRPDGLPIEVKQLIQHFRPFHILVHRSVQRSWNEFSDFIDQIGTIDIDADTVAPNSSNSKPQVNGASSNGQSAGNLEKKERILEFQRVEQGRFIRLLVLHDWVKRSQGIEKVIDLSAWMHEQRTHFNDAADFIGNMKRELALWQVPNPDLDTAAEILSRGKSSKFLDLGYVPIKPLSPKAMLRTLEEINIILCGRLTLHDRPPSPLSQYRVHDGRVTFVVPNEFELDLSIADDEPSSQFFFIDFRFLFLAHNFSLEGRFHDEFAARIDSILQVEGLVGCYDHLHDMALTHKMNSLRSQARQMALKQWSGTLNIDMISRTLVVQYWTTRPMSKSWMEIGINRGRLQPRRDPSNRGQSYPALRWMPEKKLDGDITIDFNESPLFMEPILRRVVAQHSIEILDTLYEQLVKCRLYATRKLSLSLSTSPSSPDQCHLRMQLTPRTFATLSLEPITGAFIILPASQLSGRTEMELNHLSNPRADGLPRICLYRAMAAEQEALQQAHLAGWESFRLPRQFDMGVRALLPANTLRHTLIRLAHWQKDVMVAATFSNYGDEWWLLHPREEPSGQEHPGNISYQIDPIPSGDLCEPNLEFFDRLKDFASGAVALKIAEQRLKKHQLRMSLSPLPRLKEKFEMPILQLQYLPSTARRAMDQLPLEATPSPGKVSDSPKSELSDREVSFIKPAVGVKFCGLNNRNGRALLLAKGRTTATRNALLSLVSITGSGFKVKPDNGEFLLSFQPLIGESFVLELLKGIHNLDRLLSCITVIQSFDKMQIKSLSMSKIEICYDRDTGLKAAVDLESVTMSSAISLLPEESNPQARIAPFIKILLEDTQRPFAVNVGGALSLLDTSLPLLALLAELGKTQSLPTDAKKGKGAALAITVHVIARSATHYAVQYFAAAPTRPVMVARFEIFRHMRRDLALWILRPAIEEKTSYMRSSFVDPSLQERLVTEVFNLRDAEGWNGLDSGASFPVETPRPLVKRVDDVVRSWLAEPGNQAKVDTLSKVDAQPKANAPPNVVTPSKKEVPKPASTSKAGNSKPEPKTPSRPNQSQARPQAKGGQNRPAPNTQRPQVQQTPKGPKEVITLDD